MRDISKGRKKVYHAKSVVVVPGSGTLDMEAVARQFAMNKECLVTRNGWFSYRWSQIFDMGGIPSESDVSKARPVDQGRQTAPAGFDRFVQPCADLPPAPFEALVSNEAARVPPLGDGVSTGESRGLLGVHAFFHRSALLVLHPFFLVNGCQSGWCPSRT
ncbi:class V aminotransferase [Caballeronia ptereochthonis]|uniref:Class V aminotransferase n=1 Tax=Caballeronia ptereochthonis TaxID=1777144 RepID=A0A158AWU8_9BURK|nr:class V aminotransferase [Caballeronia ptereochthonis]